MVILTTGAGYLNKVFYKNSQAMQEVPNNVVDLVVTSPPYFNIKDYALDGPQKQRLRQTE